MKALMKNRRRRSLALHPRALFSLRFFLIFVVALDIIILPLRFAHSCRDAEQTTRRKMHQVYDTTKAHAVGLMVHARALQRAIPERRRRRCRCARNTVPRRGNIVAAANHEIK